MLENEVKTTLYPSPGAKLAAALSKAQNEIKAPKKNQTVDFTDKSGRRVHYKYADLADIIEACREPLSKNDLAIINKLQYDDKYFGLLTSLVHSSGEFVDTWYPLPEPSNVDPKAFGAALTYARRYSLSAMLNIASEEDTDGADAPPPTQKSKPQLQTKPVTQARPKNHAPGAENPIPEALRDTEPVSLLDQLYSYVEDNAIEAVVVKSVIKDVTGKVKSSTQLSDNETLIVLETLKKLVLEANK